MKSSYLVGQRGPVSTRRIKSLFLALSIAALLALNVAQGPQSASASFFVGAEGAHATGGGGGAGITDGTLMPAIRPSAGAIHFV